MENYNTSYVVSKQRIKSFTLSLQKYTFIS